MMYKLMIRCFILASVIIMKTEQNIYSCVSSSFRIRMTAGKKYKLKIYINE